MYPDIDGVLEEIVGGEEHGQEDIVMWRIVNGGPNYLDKIKQFVEQHEVIPHEAMCWLNVAIGIDNLLVARYFVEDVGLDASSSDFLKVTLERRSVRCLAWMTSISLGQS